MVMSTYVGWLYMNIIAITNRQFIVTYTDNTCMCEKGGQEPIRCGISDSDIYQQAYVGHYLINGQIDVATNSAFLNLKLFTKMC